ncbi:MAG: ATP-binding protein [Fimbriimonadaceae bacterium]|nr:ATP-binding protein [Chitinophagales bacterium]
MMKIVLTGPECSGKTTLAILLANDLHVPYVKEVAREYLDSLKRLYTYDDVVNIALLQMAEEEKIKAKHPPVLICDTDILTNKIWCEDKFNRSEKWLTDALIMRNTDIYFLCTPDFPWQADPQREDANRRDIIYELYKKDLRQYGKRFVELAGSVEERMQKINFYLAPQGGMF